MEDKLQIFYENLKKKGIELPDYEKFKSDLSDPDILLAFHANLKNKGITVPDYDIFITDLGLKKKDLSEVSGEVSEVSSQEQPPLN
jgi:hypothetical protein